MLTPPGRKFARRKAIRVAFLLLAWCAAGQFIPAGALRAQQKDLTVSAAVSLKDALDEIGPPFTAQQGVALHFNLGASGTLQQQIVQGAPVDVYISASPDQMDALAKQDFLLGGTRQDLVRNSIVLIVPVSGASSVTGFKDLTKADVKFVAIGEPQTVPAGRYAQEVLTHFGLYDSLKPKFVFGKDVRSVLTYVASGNADAGIVYSTDAKTSEEIKVVASAPEDSHSPVIYPVAVIKSSKNADAAKSLVAFLLSAKAQAIFQKYGFAPAH
ncbi:MAG TPA: molybdate ABC transporter substrate-binding protein [Candidatus Acidoferrum sp.]|jgi:molybdate transport system substrate-binding protein|nr:molybdate ABC transporter substrate-binding protein [Candidatus Acidoferrum sp.]